MIGISQYGAYIPPTRLALRALGGGPAGAIAAAKLAARGWHVEVFESQHFPRFSIGESLLPTCMIHLEEVGLEEEIAAHGFQFKDGAVFWRNHAMETIDFYCN